MCYLIRCGGALGGATVIAVSARDTLRQISSLSSIGVYPTAIVKNGDRSVTLFEVMVLAAMRPIRLKLSPAADTPPLS